MCLVENQWNVAAFPCNPPQPLHNQHRESRLQLLEQRRQGGAHDACPYQDGIRPDSLHNSFPKGRMAPTMLLPP